MKKIILSMFVCAIVLSGCTSNGKMVSDLEKYDAQLVYETKGDAVINLGEKFYEKGVLMKSTFYGKNSEGIFGKNEYIFENDKIVKNIWMGRNKEGIDVKIVNFYKGGVIDFKEYYATLEDGKKIVKSVVKNGKVICKEEYIDGKIKGDECK